MGANRALLEAEAARRFTEAAVGLVSEVVLFLQEVDATRPPPRAASRALRQVAETTEDLQAIVDRGASLDTTYRLAGASLLAAAVALAEARTAVAEARQASWAEILDR